MGLVIVLLCVGVVVWFFMNYSKKIVGEWKSTAALLGLNYDGGDWMVGSLRGTLRGMNVEVSKSSRGGSENSQTFTKFTLGYPSPGPSLELTQQHSLSHWKSMLGMKSDDIVVGDQAFDDAVVVKGGDPDQIRRFLSPARRMAAMRLFNGYQFCRVTENSLEAEFRGLVSSQRELAHHIQLLVDTALVISSPNDVDLALERQADGDLGGAVEQLHQINESNREAEVPNSFTQLLEAEALMAMGDGFQAGNVLEGVALSPDDELAGWRSTAASHPTPPAFPTRASEPPMEAETVPKDAGPTAADDAEAETVPEQAAPQPMVESAPEGPVLEQQAVINDLFTSHRQSYESEDYFLATYHGQTVRWTGKVERTRQFRYDSVFEGTGQRAVVEIGTRGNGMVVTGTVDAIVQFPDDLELAEDQQIEFEGTLVRLDYYMRNLYVGNAHLL